jgi:hypothetical protein
MQQASHPAPSIPRHFSLNRLQCPQKEGREGILHIRHLMLVLARSGRKDQLVIGVTVL